MGEVWSWRPIPRQICHQIRGPEPIRFPPVPDSHPAMNAVYSPRALVAPILRWILREGKHAELVDGDVVDR
jgi:hypothetical protein